MYGVKGVGLRVVNLDPYGKKYGNLTLVIITFGILNWNCYLIFFITFSISFGSCMNWSNIRSEYLVNA